MPGAGARAERGGRHDPGDGPGTVDPSLKKNCLGREKKSLRPGALQIIIAFLIRLRSSALSVPPGIAATSAGISPRLGFRRKSACKNP